MEVTIDKFGRILIPKKIRQMLGLKPGAKVELSSKKGSDTLLIVPVMKLEPLLSTSRLGLPVFKFPDRKKWEADATEMVKLDREERDQKLMNW